MKRPCQAFAGRRVIDNLMSVFRGCFCARFTCPPGLPVPAGWVRAAAAGRAGRRGRPGPAPGFLSEGPQRLRRPGRPAGPSPQAMRSNLTLEGRPVPSHGASPSPGAAASLPEVSGGEAASVLVLTA